MPFHFRGGGTWRQPTEALGVKVRAGGGWVRAGWVWARAGGVWRLVWEDTFNFTLSGNISDINLRNSALSAGWDGVRAVTATVAGGTIVSGSGSSGAMVIDGSFPRGVILVNYGTIAGRAGNGGVGGAARGDIGVDNVNGIYGTAYAGATGGAGQRGIWAQVPVTIYNYGNIAGGGGGGGGGGSAIANQVVFDDPGGGGGK